LLEVEVPMLLLLLLMLLLLMTTMNRGRPPRCWTW
jgi:hypothetical protein